MTIKQRVQSPTPAFFRKLRNTGVALAAISASILGAPVALPAILVKIAGYLAVAGTVAATVSQTATESNLPFPEDDNETGEHEEEKPGRRTKSPGK